MRSIPKIKHWVQKNALARLWVGIVQRDALILMLACGLVSAVVLSSAFFCHFYDQNKKGAALYVDRIGIVRQVNRGITDRFSFLSKALAGVTDAGQISAILAPLPDLPHHVLSDTFVVQDNTKVTKRGVTRLVTTDNRYQKQGVFRDQFGFLCFVQKGPVGFYVIRLSMTSLASALTIAPSSLAFSLTPGPPKQSVVPLGQEGWLVFKEGKSSLFSSFIIDYLWLILFLPLISFFLLVAFLVLYSHIFFALKKAHRLYKTGLEKDLVIVKDQNITLTADNQQRAKLARALRKKQKIQAEMFQDLSKRRQKLLERTSDIARLVSHAFDDDKKVLEEGEISKLLLEMSKTATLLSEGLFEPSTATPILLVDALQKIVPYLDWHLLKSEVTLQSEIDEKCALEMDQRGFRLLFINLLVRHIERAYEGAIVLLGVTQREGRIEIDIKCEASCSRNPPLGTDSAANPLMFTDEALAKLAKILGFSSFTSDLKRTTLVYTPQESRQVVDGDNIVALFQ